MPADVPCLVLEHRVIAEMRVAVDHAVMAERIPPGAEHGTGDLVMLFERPVGVVEQTPPLSQVMVISLCVESSGRPSGTRIKGSPAKIMA